MATYFVTLIDTLSTIEVVIATGYDIHALHYLDPALVYYKGIHLYDGHI